MRFNKLIPELSVKNFDKSMEFYLDILGFKIEYKREESRFALISFQGSQIMIEEVNNHWSTGKLDHPFGRGINFQIMIENIEPLLDTLKKNKYPLFIEPKEHWYRINDQVSGNKEFLVQDPDGYLLRFAEDLGKKPV